MQYQIVLSLDTASSAVTMSPDSSHSSSWRSRSGRADQMASAGVERSESGFPASAP